MNILQVRNKTLLLLAAVINIGMILLLVHKQNMMIHQLYELQQLYEKRDFLLQQKKELVLQLHKLKQLSVIESVAHDKLGLRSMILKDAQQIPLQNHEG